MKKLIGALAASCFAVLAILTYLYQVSDCPKRSEVETLFGLEIQSHDDTQQVKEGVKHLTCTYQTAAEVGPEKITVDVFTFDNAQGPQDKVEAIRTQGLPANTDPALSALKTPTGGFVFVIAPVSEQIVRVGYTQGRHFCEAKLIRPFRSEEQRNQVGGLRDPVGQLAKQACDKAG